MKAAFLAAILVSSAVMGPNFAQAASSEPYNHGQAGWVSYHPRAATVPQRPLWMMDLTPRKPLQRPYEQTLAEPRQDVTPTTVSYRVTPDGPVGSLGLVHMASHAVDPSLLSNAVANQPGAPSQTVGAALAYNFR